VKQAYQVIERNDSRALAEVLSKEGQLLLPLLELVEKAELAVDELIDVAGRSTIEAVLTLSAQQVAGAKHPGQEQGTIRWHGRQQGLVPLSDRKLRVSKPRLRRKGKGPGREVEIPVYEALQSNSRLGSRLLEILMRGVSTRNYQEVLPAMAESVGMSKSAVSREFQEASEESLKELCERRFEEKDILVVYLEGLIFGGHHVLVALGVDVQGIKHVLGLAEGGSENAVVAKGLLEDLVERGVKPGRRRLFVIDGSKALRSAIDAVYGKENPVQRCRNHKVRNVLGYLPEPLRDQVGAAMKAAYRLEADQGMMQLEKQAQWLEREHPDAAASLREGLAETFTVNRLGLPSSLRRCLGTTNVIESPNGTVRQKIGRVKRWRDGAMVLRWTASAFLASENSFRRLMGCQQLWMLEARLNESQADETMDRRRRVG
jgi:transposase-like protein